MNSFILQKSPTIITVLAWEETYRVCLLGPAQCPAHVMTTSKTIKHIYVASKVQLGRACWQSLPSRRSSLGRTWPTLIYVLGIDGPIHVYVLITVHTCTLWDMISGLLMSLPAEVDGLLTRARPPHWPTTTSGEWSVKPNLQIWLEQ